MTEQPQFPAASPRFALPLLYAGQSQKEFFVNEAMAITDALLHCAIEKRETAPPAAPVDGATWLIGDNPVGEWSSHAGELACRQAGNWLFVTPHDGMRVLDRSTGQEIVFFKSWQTPAAPLEPSGGSVVDSQARAAIAQLITALRTAGILPAM